MTSCQVFVVAPVTLLILAICSFLPLAVLGKETQHLNQRRGLRSTAVDEEAFAKDLQEALGSALGCGGATSEEEMATISRKLKPIWNALPKNKFANVERRMLRYLAHRYFMQSSQLLIRGFEPSRPVNHSHWGAADILSQQVPGIVESVIESQHAVQRGFSLQDAVTVVAMLQELIRDSDSAFLERVYKEHQKSTKHSLSSTDLSKILEDYLVHWMLGDDKSSLEMILQNRTVLEASFPHWHELVNFAKGEIRTFEYTRSVQQEARLSDTHGLFEQAYSFDDAAKMVNGITKSFASFWEQECTSMKASLVAMDKDGTGRVPLSAFYGTGMDADWRFGESESYLRELGALDETSLIKGVQVIIPNYIQAASNCIVATPHYLVCCANECDELLGEIEVAIGGPLASSSQILAAVANMTLHATIDDETTPRLDWQMQTQLNEVASLHGGQVPLHGRLFAQWLHYVFPRTCAFPHKLGTVGTLTPMEFGEDYIATNQDMEKHVEVASLSLPNISVDFAAEETHWMSQWSLEEELMVDYAGQLHAPWEQLHHRQFALGGLLMLVLAVVWRSFHGVAEKAKGSLLPIGSGSKSHIV